MNGTTRIAIALGTAAVLSAGLLLALPRGMKLVHGKLSAAWSEELATASDERVLALIAELEARDTDALPPLVAGLTSDRKIVTSESATALLRLLDRWESLPASAAAERYARLASLLGDASPRVPQSQWPVARQIAGRILVQPFDPEEVDAAQVLAACELVLLHCKPSPPAAIDPELASANQEATTDIFLPDIEAVPPHEPADSLDSAGDENLPLLVGRRHTAESGEPQLIDPAPERTAAPKRFLAPKAMPIPTTTARDIDAGSELLLPDDRYGYLRSLSDVDVMQHLHTSDEARIAAATSELFRRGFESRHLPLARALTHPDPAVRRKLVESLPQLADIDARPWLVHLSADPDAEVRRAAQGILQTSERLPSKRR